MHFDGFAFSDYIHGGEGEDHTWFKETGLDSADWDSSDTTNLVDVLEGKSQWLILGSLWLIKSIKGINKTWASVPFHVVGFIDHVVSTPS